MPTTDMGRIHIVAPTSDREIHSAGTPVAEGLTSLMEPDLFLWWLHSEVQISR